MLRFRLFVLAVSVYPAIPGGKNGGKTMKHKGTRNLAILLALALLFALVPGLSEAKADAEIYAIY